jgi:hypothetical protein
MIEFVKFPDCYLSPFLPASHIDCNNKEGKL